MFCLKELCVRWMLQKKTLVIIIYIYVNFYMKKSVGREEDLSWFDLQERLPRLFQLLVQILLLSHFLQLILFGYWIQKPIQTDHMGGREDNATDFSSCFVQIEIRPWTPFCCIRHHATYVGSGICFCFHANIY